MKGDGVDYFGKISPDEAIKFMAGSVHPLRDLAASKVGNRRITDLGCGKGIKVSTLYRPEQYIGVDCSAELIEIARRDNPGYSFFHSGILEYLEHIPDQAIEVAVMVSVLEHIPSREAALKIYHEAHRASKELLVGWHTVPNAGKDKLSRIQAELTEPLHQNRWQQGIFTGATTIYPSDHAELWSLCH